MILSPLQAIKKALDLIGSQEVAAEKLGLKTQAQISSWITGRRPLPSKHCIKIEELTDQQITRYQLRPDVFGQAPDDQQAA